MELDELKTLWNQYHKQTIPKTPIHTQTEILQMTKRRAKGIFAKIHRGIFIELLINSSLVLICGVCWLLNILPLFSLTIACFATVFLINYIIKYNMLRNSMIHPEENFRENLEQYVRIMGGYMNAYWVVVWAIVLGSGVLYMGLIVDQYQKHLKNEISFDYFSVVSTVFLSYYFGITILTMWFFKKYLNAFYGKYLSQLKSFLGELHD
ncbi:MAG: hypothetical protein EAZ55_04015 [Cytophagales bacterium]|nr:MAG: hypothetical protein EAZ55_04015 [Cytophagales bacterium]